VGSWSGLAVNSTGPPDNIAAILAAVTIKTSAEGTSINGVTQTSSSLPGPSATQAQIGAVCAA
jgi:hypothetical protein